MRESVQKDFITDRQILNILNFISEFDSLRGLTEKTKRGKKRMTEKGSSNSNSPYMDSPPQKESRRLVPACKRCHSLKVRCIPVEPDVHFGLCKRCQKSGSDCQYDLTNTKKRKPGQQLTVSKKLRMKSQEIEELKQRIIDQDRMIRNLRGMQSSSENKVSVVTLTSTEKLLKYGEEIDDLKNVLNACDVQSRNDFVHVSEERTVLSEQFIEYKKHNIINEGLLTIDECQRLIDVFSKQILPRYPFIEIPNDLSVMNLMRTDYLLFLIIVYIGLSADEESNSVPISTHLQLESLISRSLSVEILSVGNKNLSLLRSLLLYCIWYPSPELFHHRRYHLFTLLCASMANDLGLTGRPYLFFNREDDTFQRINSEVEQPYEIKSIILVIYIVMGSISLFLRRRVLFQWTEYMGQCCLLLEQSDNRNYQLIGLYARLNYVLEKIYVNVHSTSEQLTVLELSSTNNRMLIQEYQNQLNAIKQTINSAFDENNSDFHSLMSYLYSAQAYLYEPGIQALIRSKGQLTEEHQNIIYNTLSQLCESCFLTVEHFLELSDEAITSNPLFHTSRIIYTSEMLLKIRHLSLTMIGSNKWGIFTDGALELISKLIKRMESTIGKYPRNHFLKKAKIVLGLFTQTCLNQWYSSYRDLSTDIKQRDLGFVDPREGELEMLKNHISNSQQLNYPFQQINESGKTQKLNDDPALPPLEAIDDFEQQLLSLNDDLWTDLFFSEHNL